MTGDRAVTLPLLDATSLQPILDVPGQDFRAWLSAHQQPNHRYRQIRRWILGTGVQSFDDMTDLPKSLRQELAVRFVPLGTTIARQQSASDGTHKLLVRLRDGRLVECVLIQEDNRRTACISTQVGCGMGCVFCASGLNGVERNLTSGEILEQLIRLRSLPLPNDQSEGLHRLTHIVVMGMGEPLANFDALMEALRVASDKNGLGIGARHITISTVGLPNRIRQLADLGKQYHLAVSLHAPNDELRCQIVPTNDKTGIDAILSASDYFFDQTGRQVTFEYVLLRDVNDSSSYARELAELLSGRRAHVNLIPFNDVEGLPYKRPDQQALNTFVTSLRQKGISVKVRKRKGSEIDAACGQLRRAESSKAPT